MISNQTIATGLLALVLMFGSTAVMAQQNPFVGTWKMNSAKSHFDPANLTLQGSTIHIEATGNNAVKTTVDGKDAKGAPTHTEFTATMDNKDYPYSGSGDYDSIAIKVLSANTHINVYKKGGTVVRVLRNIVSKDGKTYTLDQVGYNVQGVAYHNVVVYDRQ